MRQDHDNHGVRDAATHRYLARPPQLETMNLPPSWCNARGHVDRSACIELTIAQARELAGCVPHVRAARARSGMNAIDTARRKAWKRKRIDGRFAPANDGLTAEERTARQRAKNRELRRTVMSLPDERPALNGRGRVAIGTVKVIARQLHLLHRRCTPRTLAGDYRTARAPAMRGSIRKKPRTKAAKFRTRVTKSQPIARLKMLDANPNRGAMREKMIGLDSNWCQTIRIEKWVYPKRIAPTYHFVCPCRADERGIAKSSTRPPGREDPSTGRCPQRCRKLLMVQCTKAEYRDAQLAESWIRCLPNQVRSQPHVRTTIAALMQRYGMIMSPRLLLCPRCCGVRYGNNPEAARSAWRRKHGLADYSLRGADLSRLIEASEPLSQHNRDLLQDIRDRLWEPERRAWSRQSPESIERRRLRRKELLARHARGPRASYRYCTRTSLLKAKEPMRAEAETMRETLAEFTDPAERKKAAATLAWASEIALRARYMRIESHAIGEQMEHARRLLAKPDQRSAALAALRSTLRRCRRMDNFSERIHAASNK